MMSGIQVEFHRGVYLPELDLWLDPHDPKPRAFVSHAHADHVAPHEESICSATTKRLVEKRFGKRGEIRGFEFGQTFELGKFRAELLPAGHILGSAQLWLERMEDGASLLYTGDFKLRQGVAAEPVEAKKADTLIMETTFGLPKYRMPPGDEVLDDLVRFLREAIEDGQVPVVGAYSLGKAQELIFSIQQRAPELKLLLHSAVAKMTKLFGEFGYDLPEFETLGKDSSFEGRVVVVPPNALRSQQIRRVKNRLTAMVSGWAIDSGARYRYQVDKVFPLSDHAGYGDLVRYVELVKPERVLTLHGFAKEFAVDLRNRGWEAWALTGENQMELGFGSGIRKDFEQQRERSLQVGILTDSATGFGKFALVCDEIAKSTGKLKKVAILSEYLGSLDESDLPIATVFLTGKPFGDKRTLNVGHAILRRALLEASGRSEAEYRQLTQGQNDAGRAAFLMLEGRTKPGPFSLGEVHSFFERLAEARGPATKGELLREQLARLHPAEAQCLVGILTGDLRIGLKEGLLEDAIAKAFDSKVAEVRRAHMLLGDLGQTANLARKGELYAARVTPFVPIKVMLASPEETAEDIWNRLGENDDVWLEDKFDGIRAQLHRTSDRVELYSRDLRPLTREFPELIEPATQLSADVILDGEIIAFAEGKKLTFFDLQKRLGRKNEGDLFFGPSIPVRFVAFDLLWRDGEDFLDRPLQERRVALENLDLSDPFETVEVRCGDSAESVEAEFKAARLRDNEGLIAKDPSSAYSPGRRGLSWLKLKKPMATLDCVVVKAEEGHGKRSHVLSDYTFALRDERTGELATIGKAYSGLTDVEIEELTEHFKEHTISKRRRAHWVTPNVILEIAFDSIQPSKRHDSGLALRFPRIKAIRRDKTPGDIDTVQFARKLAK